MKDHYQFYLLGTFYLEQNQHPHPFIKSRKGRAMLGYLISQQQPVLREQLATIFWPDKPEKTGRRNISRELSQLAAFLQDCFETTRQTIQFAGSDNYSVDLWQVTTLLRQAGYQPHRQTILTEALYASSLTYSPIIMRYLQQLQPQPLENALTLYRGDFMADHNLPDSEQYQSWLIQQQIYWHVQRLAILESLLVYYAVRHQDGLAVTYARQWQSLEPSQEQPYHYLMLLLARNGRRAEALTVYDQYRQSSTDRPTEALTQFYQQLTLMNQPIPPRSLRHTDFPASPYRGLAPFTKQNSALFFGRSAMLERLEMMIKHHKITLLVGASGSGKTSLIQAGLLPRLQGHQTSSKSQFNNRSQQTMSKQATPPNKAWFTLLLRPGDTPFLNLATVLHLYMPPHYPTQVGPLADYLADPGHDVTNLVPQILSRQSVYQQGLLVVDQFEELYTLSAPSTRQRYLELLLSLIRADCCCLLLTMRADFVEPFLQYRPLADQLIDSTLMLGPLNETEMVQAIEEPAKQRGVLFEPGLVNRLITDVGDTVGRLPLLQFALHALWQAQAEQGGPLQHATYEAIGQVSGALSQYADTIYAELDEENQARLRNLFLQLVQPGQQTADTRRLAQRQELGEPLWQLAQQLSHSRLIVTNRIVEEGETVELVHEALIQHWNRLQIWLDDYRAFRVWQERLRQARHDWERSEHDEAVLLRGSVLAEAEGWYNLYLANLSQPEIDFISASLQWRADQVQQAEAQRQRELAQAKQLAETEQRTSEQLRTLLVLAVDAARRANLAQQEAEREAELSYSLNLTTSARLALTENHTDLALALALAANAVENPPPQAEFVLSEAAYAPGTQRLFVGHAGPVNTVHFSPDEQAIISGSDDQTLIMWDVETGDIIRRFEGHQGAVLSAVSRPISALPLSQKEGKLLSASADGTIILWDMETGHQIRQFVGHAGPVHCLALSKDGQTVLSGSADHDLILWEIETGQIIRRFAGHTDTVLTVAFSPDEQTILSGTSHQELIRWDSQTGHILNRITGREAWPESYLKLSNTEPRGSIRDIVFNRTGEWAVSIRNHETIFLWSLQPNEPDSLTETDRPTEAKGSIKGDYINLKTWLYSLALSPDEQVVLVSTLSNQLLLVDLAQKQVQLELLGHAGQVFDVAFSHNGRFAISGGMDGQVRLWHLYHGAEMRQINFPLERMWAVSLALSPNGQEILSSFADKGTLVSWNLETKQEIRQFQGHQEMVYGGIICHPNGKWVISGSGDIWAMTSKDNTIRVWDVKTGQERHRLDQHTTQILRMALSPDGDWIASTSYDGTARLWNLETQAERLLLDLNPIVPGGIAFHPAGKQLLIGTGQGRGTKQYGGHKPTYDLLLVDLATGEIVRHFSGHQAGVRTVMFHPDGQMAVSGGFDKQAIIWNVTTGQIIHRLQRHQGVIFTVKFSPDGRFVVTASGDNTLILWDVETGEAKRHFSGHNGPVSDLIFTPSGTILSASTDYREWRIDDSLESLKAWLNQNRYIAPLTAEQRVQYQVKPLC